MRAILICLGLFLSTTIFAQVEDEAVDQTETIDPGDSTVGLNGSSKQTGAVTEPTSMANTPDPATTEIQEVKSRETKTRMNYSPDHEKQGIVSVLMRITLIGSVWVLWLLLILSVISGAIMVERIYFFRKEGIDFSKFIMRVANFLNADDIGGLKEFCKRHRVMESKMILMAIINQNKGLKAIEKSMSGYIAWQKTRLDKGLMFLGTLGNNAPFIGLFGTVLGIIQAFHDLSLNPAGGVGVVMSGISEALVSTAVGLFVAIPAVIAFNTFQRIVKQRLSNAEAVQDLVMTHFSDEQKNVKKAS